MRHLLLLLPFLLFDMLHHDVQEFNSREGTRLVSPASKLITLVLGTVGAAGVVSLVHLGFPQPIYQINQGVNGHTTMAPPGVPHTRASLEPETSGFSTLRINHCATRGGLVQVR